MARKKLLSEGEIRQFMKLANLTPLGHGRLEEMGFGFEGDGALEEEEEEEMQLDMEPDMPPADDAPMDDMDMGDDMDMDMGDEGAGGAGMVSIEDFMSALESALEEVTGEPVTTDVDGEDSEELDMDMDADEAPLADDPPAMDMEPEEDEEPPGMRDYMEEGNQDAIVSEVAARVVARLKGDQNRRELVDNLAERIMQKLVSK